MNSNWVMQEKHLKLFAALSGVKRTRPLCCEMSAFDPNRTSVGPRSDL